MNKIIAKIKEPVTKRRLLSIAMFCALFGIASLSVMHPTFAANTAGKDVADILEKFVGIITLIFRAIGVILGVYAAGQLIMAFKNEDADSKSRASSLLVVAVVLIAFKSIVEDLGIINLIKK